MDQISPDPFDGLAADDPARSRNDSRDSLFLMADMRISGRTAVHSVRVRNLSPGGLMAEYPTGLPQGLAVELEMRGIGAVPGRVAWSAAGRVGIAFEYQIDPLSARKPVGTGGKSQTLFKPSL